MFDMGKTLIKTLIYFLSCLFIGTAILMALIASSTFVMLMVPLLLIILAVAGVILTFVPFFEKKVWLIPILQIAVAGIVAIIVHFIS